ncbi:MAG: hypothetical protein GWN99_16080 [Gemmatimonadetes bacterium]|uniref:WD40 repeat protein n=1 Tax=Candidatus Kutchimonas denitrificans TaxID=3056748 RepID=A0AAE4Z654_9BACT|nr:hypothetical protein [Gemmatimonadota bacterium]NIR74303.1 hypothetical protein [Candidatus Kutchimonas denitrificans]NIS02558.1 hypothetical protein [Gemmatimonadota bacterium]NIT68434.1 hypothetical protein [Gemmatimonadota bacterium]NIU51886.1 hypothetical protein [Gemmatimonadota bacterium]
MSEAAAMNPVLVWMDLLVSILGGLVVAVLGALLLGAVCVGCAALLTPRDRTTVRRSRYALAVLWIGLALTAGVPNARAQTESAEDVPQIEPRYTRVFGSDTLDIMFPQVSPDGRWIAFADYRTEGDPASDIWIVSADGGDPTRLTSGGWNVAPDWFPTSDRIAFSSTEVDGVMTLPIDPETGAAAGPAQRVTLESAAWPALVSPDGQSIAYRVRASEGAEMGWALRVIPAQGGTARTVMRLPGQHYIEFWSRDGEYIYFTRREPEAPRGSLEWMRVSVDDGTMEEVEDAPTGDASPIVPYLIEADGKDSATGEPLHVITTLDGRPLARVRLPGNAIDLNGVRFAPDGRHIVAVTSNSVSPLHLLPIAGGEARQLGDARSDDMPIGWTADGQRVIYQTQLDGRVAIMAAPVDGGAAEEYTVLPEVGMSSQESPVVVSESGRYIAYVTSVPESELRTLMIARAADGQTRKITDSLYQFRLVGIAGRGGGPSSRDEFIYLERNGERVELRAASFDGPSRLLRTFPSTFGTGMRPVIGVADDRVVWTENAGDATAVMLAEGPDGAPRELARVPALFADLVWSPDERWIAGSVFRSEGSGIILLAMTPDGELASEPRFIAVPILVGWDLRWMPDSQALTIMSQSLPSGKTNVWLVPIHEGEEPVAITEDETSEFWFTQRSPDGRYIAYPAQVQRGSSLWMVDLGDALASGN